MTSPGGGNDPFHPSPRGDRLNDNHHPTATTTSDNSPLPRLLLELEALKRHLLRTVPQTPLPLPPPCNATVTLSADHAAIRAAVGGLDREVERIRREEKLKRKFAAAAGTSASSAGGGAATSAASLDETGYVKMSRTDAVATAAEAAFPPSGEVDGMDIADEWQEANDGDGDGGDARRRSSAVAAQNLAAEVVSRIAGAGTTARSPCAALALALHAALLSLGDEFRCTGLPERKGKSSSSGRGGGFAAPIRELSRGKFVPEDWEGSDGDGGEVALRYKRRNSGTIVLLVFRKSARGGAAAAEEEEEVTATLGPSGESGAPGVELTFPLGEHLNLDGWRVAAAKGGAVSPCLFYVSLSTLMERFGAAFGLEESIQRAHGTEDRDGGEKETRAAATAAEAARSNSLAAEAMDADEAPAAGSHGGATGSLPSAAPVFPPATAVRVPVCAPNFESRVPRPVIPSNRARVDEDDALRIATGGGRRPGRHFDDDLLPGGLRPGVGSLPGFADPAFGEGGGRMGMGGSHVGPNHPLFDRTFGDEGGGGFGGWEGGGRHPHPSGVGGMGMQPRFDHYGPPGGPTDPGRGGRGMVPGRGGRGRGGRGGRSIPGGGSGNPNPDHMRPPNSDYFF